MIKTLTRVRFEFEFFQIMIETSKLLCFSNCGVVAEGDVMVISALIKGFMLSIVLNQKAVFIHKSTSSCNCCGQCFSPALSSPSQDFTVSSL